jgi:hypothetical protein
MTSLEAMRIQPFRFAAIRCLTSLIDRKNAHRALGT